MTEVIEEEIVDLAFRLHGGRIPVDHAFALSSEIGSALPWFAKETAVRLHLVHTAESGSGWLRPDESPDAELHLSRRTKLTLRVPKRRTTDAMALSGRTMEIHGHEITPGNAKVIPLVPAGTLLARYVVCEHKEDESRFVARLQSMLLESGVGSATLICGRAHQITTPDSVIPTRSLVVTNLDHDGAMCLLRSGIGPAGKLGCGIFIPYKRID
ncbi:MAG TPA: type I-MYXAN CRISPR-associated protein Cas6/Cmx6 [Gammaproteobacteria bacterium]